MIPNTQCLSAAQEQRTKARGVQSMTDKPVEPELPKQRRGLLDYRGSIKTPVFSHYVRAWRRPNSSATPNRAGRHCCALSLTTWYALAAWADGGTRIMCEPRGYVRPKQPANRPGWPPEWIRGCLQSGRIFTINHLCVLKAQLFNALLGVVLYFIIRD